MPRKPADNIPGVDYSELVDAVRSLPRIPETTLDDFERFAIRIRALVEARAQSQWPNETTDDIAVFVQVPYPRQTGERFSAVPVFDLKESDCTLLGNLFFLNRDGSSGRMVALPCKQNEILEWLTDNGLGANPIVTVHRKTKLLTSRARGCDGGTRSEEIRDVSPAATPEQLEKALALAHRANLLIPSLCPDGVWKGGAAASYVPGVTPEKAIQKMLRIALISSFQDVLKVSIEDPTDIGRIDIRLLTYDKCSGKLSYWAILELKVVKSFHHPKCNEVLTKVTDDDNASDVAEGVRQARAFSKSMCAQPYLDVYDLRRDKNPKVLEHKLVVDELQRDDVKPTCRLWPVYGSASDARKAGWS